jgi:hypothetical protein
VSHSQTFAEELAAQIGGGIDQQISLGQAQNSTRTGSLVAWSGIRADGAAAAQSGHADTRSGPEQDHFAGNVYGFRDFRHCHAFLPMGLNLIEKGPGAAGLALVFFKKYGDRLREYDRKKCNRKHPRAGKWWPCDDMARNLPY